MSAWGNFVQSIALKLTKTRCPFCGSPIRLGDVRGANLDCSRCGKNLITNGTPVHVPHLKSGKELGAESPNVHLIKTSLNLRVRVPKRNTGSTWPLAVMGLGLLFAFYNIFANTEHRDWSFYVIVMGLVVALYLWLSNVFNVTSIAIGPNNLEVFTRPFPLEGRKTFPKKEIRKISASEEAGPRSRSGLTTSRWYIRLLHVDPVTHTQTSLRLFHVRDKNDALYIERVVRTELGL